MPAKSKPKKLEGVVEADETSINTSLDQRAAPVVHNGGRWDGADRRYFSEHSMKLLTEHEEVAIPELTAA